MSEPETLTLEAFLAGLADEDAAQARVAAARIDALEREIGPPGWIERNLMRLALAALALFVLGVGGLIGVLGWVRAIFGLGGVGAGTDASGPREDGVERAPFPAPWRDLFRRDEWWRQGRAGGLETGREEPARAGAGALRRGDEKPLVRGRS